MSEPRPFKLFVLGESSGDPATWGGHYALAAARDKQEAAALHELFDRPEYIHEVHFTKPEILYVEESGLLDRT